MRGKRYMSAGLIALVLYSPLVLGCGGKPEPTSQQKEEKRQQMIKNAERERRESK